MAINVRLSAVMHLDKYVLIFCFLMRGVLPLEDAQDTVSEVILIEGNGC
jgi:hypothetical protein